MAIKVTTQRVKITHSALTSQCTSQSNYIYSMLWHSYTWYSFWWVYHEHKQTETNSSITNRLKVVRRRSKDELSYTTVARRIKLWSNVVQKVLKHKETETNSGIMDRLKIATSLWKGELSYITVVKIIKLWSHVVQKVLIRCIYHHEYKQTQI